MRFESSPSLGLARPAGFRFSLAVATGSGTFLFERHTMLDRIKKWLATSRTWDPSCDHLVNAQGRPACDMRGRINPDCRGCTEYHQNQLRYVDQVELLQRRADALGRIIVVLRGELAKLKARVPQYEQRIAENQEKKDGHEKCDG